MSISMWDVSAGKPLNDVHFIINDYPSQEGLRITDCKGEKVWKKGGGWLTAPPNMGLRFTGGPMVHIEAWSASQFCPVFILEIRTWRAFTALR